MKQYQDLVRDILENGVEKMDRTGVGTISVFGRQMRFDLSKGFPLVTTKKTHFRSIVHELLWFISGSTNIKYLKDNGVSIWDEWADEKGELGPVYGHQWRHWNATKVFHNDFGHELVENKWIDQLQDVIERIKAKPNDRRLIVTAWNPADVPSMKLPPCHCFFQFYTANGKLSCMMYQRSCDTFLGVPFNIASYALLTHMVAQVTGFEPGEFVHVLADTHIYLNHIEQARELLKRDPRPLPTLKLNPEVKSIFDFKFEDVVIDGYDPHPAIKATVAV